jgi:acetolactate synthase-1/2/3 large subunit
MAEGVYKTTGKVAAVIGNPGPGSANLLPGVLTAKHEGVPVVVITAQHRLGIVYPTPPSTFQGQDQIDLFKPMVKWGGPILSWDRIPDVVRMAFREMWTGRPGPVHLEIPAPVIHATGDEKNVTVLPAERTGRDSLAFGNSSAVGGDAWGHGVRFISAQAWTRGRKRGTLEIVELINCP